MNSLYLTINLEIYWYVCSFYVEHWSDFIYRQCEPSCRLHLDKVNYSSHDLLYVMDIFRKL